MTQVPEVQLVGLVAVVVDGAGEAVAVRADVEDTDREVVVAVGELVLVEDEHPRVLDGGR